MVDAVSSFFLFVALTNALFRSIFTRISVENLYRNIFDGKEYSIDKKNTSLLVPEIAGRSVSVVRDRHL